MKVLLMFSAAILLHSIAHVVGSGADKQVRGVATGRIVAAVKNQFALRYFPVNKLVRKPVRSLVANVPVPVPVGGAKPFPAVFRPADFYSRHEAAMYRAIVIRAARRLEQILANPALSLLLRLSDRHGVPS